MILILANKTFLKVIKENNCSKIIIRILSITILNKINKN